MITDQGTIIRTPASDLSVLSRSAGGVIVMRLPEGQYVANNLHFAAAIAFIMMIILLVGMALMRKFADRYTQGGV